MTIDGAKLKKIRENRGFTLVQLAEMSGVNKNTINEIELNKANPTLKTINDLAKALAIDPQKLFLGSE